MRLRVALFAAMLAGCAVEPAPDEVRQLRQAGATFPPFPQHVGLRSEARLGTSVAECRGPGFVAGAPGANATFIATDGGAWFLDPGTSGDAGAVGLAVACDGPPGGVFAVTAGDEGGFVLDQRGARLDYRPVAALARAAGPGLPLLMGQPELGLVRGFTLTDAGYVAVFALTGTQGLGAALEWNEAGAYFAVGNPDLGQVTTYSWTDAGAVLRSQLPGGPGLGFGSALAIGDVHPSAGVELIVGAPGASKVLIYGSTGVLLMVLDGAALGGPGFGTSLVIEPAPAVATTLRALWVGDPTHDRVFRFIGDAGTASAPGLGPSAFGFSMAASEQNLIVGAPLYSDALTRQGAVFVAPFNTMPVNGVVMQCTVGQPCITSSCTTGSCLGGVVCQGPFTSVNCAFGCSNGVCLSADGGSLDAGRDAGSVDAGRDAGEGDAGEADAGEADAGEADAGDVVKDGGAQDGGSSDAGVKDAGSSDAGPGDGGPVQFTSCGCSGGSALPLLLLSLALFRRRRGQHSGPSP